MSDEHFSLTPSAPSPPTEADYEAIAAAVMETVRGRWFLGEYAKRNRNADTELILKGLERIERMVRDRPPEPAPAERVRIDLVEMAKAIAKTRAEIAAIKPDGDAKGTLSEATEELDSIVQTTEQATSDILAAAEQVQEIAWTLRERGTDGELCDALDRRATDIYSACSFQDLTGQRTRKVVDVLQFLEERIRAMIEIWGGAVPDMGEQAAVAAPHLGEDPNVPHLGQGEIDRIMPSRSDTPEPSRNGHDTALYEAGGRTFMASAAEDRGVAAGATSGGETALNPAVAIVGATALALDFAATEVARQSEPRFQAERHVEAEPHREPELQAAPDAYVEPEHQLEARAEPEPQAAAEPEAEPEPQAAAKPEAEPEAQAAAEPEAAPEPQAAAEPEAEPELRAAAEPDAERELQAAAGSEAEPEPQAAPGPQTGPDPTPVPPDAIAPAASPGSTAEPDAVPGEQRADPAAVLKRILAIIRAPNDASAGPAAPGAPSAPADMAAPAEIETAPTVGAEAFAEAAASDDKPTAADALVAAEALALAAEALAAQAPATPVAIEAPVAVDAPVAADAPVAVDAPMAGDTVVTDVLAPEAAIAVDGTAEASADSSPPPEDAAVPAPPPSIGDTAADEVTPLAGPLTVDQAVDEMLMRSRPQPRAPAVAPSAPAEPVGSIEPQAPEWTTPSAAPAAPIAQEPEPAEPISPGPSVVIEMPELTVARLSDPPAQPMGVPEPTPDLQPAARSAAPPTSALPAAAVAQAAPSESQTMLPDNLPTPGPAVALSVATIALPPTHEPAVMPAPVAAAGPVPAAEPPAAAISGPPARHEALAVIAALSDDEKIALFS